MENGKRAINMVGQRFGRLVVLGLDADYMKKDNNTYWKVRCDCGTEFTTTRGNLIVGHARSCGCLKRELMAGNNRRKKRQ